MKQTMLRKNNL